MRKNFQFNAFREPRIDGFSIYVLDKTFDGTANYVTDVQITTIPLEEAQDGMWRPAPIELSKESAQSLMDALWEAGVKPSGGEGHTAHIRALNDHLDSMKKIAFKQLGIE